MENLGLKNIFTNTISQLTVRFLSSFSTLIVTLLISYFLGISLFGSFTKIVTFVSLFYLAVDFGINGIFIQKTREEIEKNFINLILLRFLLSLILYICIGLITIVLPYNAASSIGFSPFEKIGILIYSFTLFTQGLAISFAAIQQKTKNYKTSIIPSFITSVTLLSFVLAGTFLQNIYIILLSYVMSGILFGVLLFFSVLKKFPVKKKVHNFFKFSKPLLFSSAPLGLILLFNLIYAKADTVILSFLRPTGDIGIYGFSYRIFEFLIAIPAFFANSIYPLLLEKKSTSFFYRDIKRYSFLLTLISIVFIFFVFFLSPLLPVLKPELSYVILPIRILSLSLPFFFLTSILQWVLVIENKKMFLIFLYLFSLFLNIVLNIFYIPHYSYIAASVITVICEGIVFSGMVVYLALQRTKNI